MEEFVKVLLPVIVSLLIVAVSWLATCLIIWWANLYEKAMKRATARRFAEQLGLSYMEQMDKTANTNNDGGGHQI